MAVNQEIKSIISEIKYKCNYNQSEIASELGVKSTYLSDVINGRAPFSENLKNNIYEVFSDRLGWNEVVKQDDTDEGVIPKGELKPKEYSHTLQVRVVTNKAKAGWADGYYNDEYLEDMPIITIDADANHRGKYLAFEVAGDSMEPDYLEGDIVICREVQRHLWTSKLHIRDWDFVIAHYTEGIMLKEIIDHNVEKGIITCHSLNPNYKDFKMKLREVSSLYNVVEVRQKGRSKRWNRAKDFFDLDE